MKDITLHHGDCLQILQGIESESMDMVFADPPFNVGKKYGRGGDNRTDYMEWCAKWIEECFRVLKPTGSFYLMTIDRHLEKLFPMMGQGGVFVNLIKWRNVSGAQGKRTFWNSTQPILFYGKTAEYKFDTYAQTRKIAARNLRWGGYSTRPRGQLLDYWDDIPFVYAGGVRHPEAILIPGTNRKAHPAQMPVSLADRCILFSTDEGDTVLDPFCGSGTVGVSCMKLDRRFIGIEREGEYVKMTRERWAKKRLQPWLGLEMI